MSVKRKPIWIKIVTGCCVGFMVLSMLSCILGLLTVNKILPYNTERVNSILVLIISSWVAGLYVAASVKKQKIMYGVFAVFGLMTLLALVHAIIAGKEPFYFMDNLIASSVASIIIVLTKGMNISQRRF